MGTLIYLTLFSLLTLTLTKTIYEKSEVRFSRAEKVIFKYRHIEPNIFCNMCLFIPYYLIIIFIVFIFYSMVKFSVDLYNVLVYPVRILSTIRENAVLVVSVRNTKRHYLNNLKIIRNIFLNFKMFTILTELRLAMNNKTFMIFQSNVIYEVYFMTTGNK